MPSNRPRVPRTPTLPQGDAVATYGTYSEATKAVEVLATHEFPVQLVTIVGTDLRMVERVTGRLSYPRVASGGFVMGAWFGLFVGLILTWFTTEDRGTPIVPAMIIGGAFGLLLSVLTYAFTRGRRDFTSASQIVASSYTLLCDASKAHQARNLLMQHGGLGSTWPPPAVPTQQVPTQQVPSTRPDDEQPGPPTQPPAPPQS
ncbi:general stress protein [Cellulomonas sp. HZM]|uniref:general stress protein n=1 Tax=Cellulomonas sp. HZM TaxID=1454010 RepID=UPI00068939A2|nr:general stress protein [Cellulomonas sp. HZM]